MRRSKFAFETSKSAAELSDEARASDSCRLSSCAAFSAVCTRSNSSSTRFAAAASAAAAAVAVASSSWVEASSNCVSERTWFKRRPSAAWLVSFSEIAFTSKVVLRTVSFLVDKASDVACRSALNLSRASFSADVSLKVSSWNCVMDAFNSSFSLAIFSFFSTKSFFSSIHLFFSSIHLFLSSNHTFFSSNHLSSLPSHLFSLSNHSLLSSSIRRLYSSSTCRIRSSMPSLSLTHSTSAAANRFCVSTTCSREFCNDILNAVHSACNWPCASSLCTF
mmetsp:Transcript_6340/g.12304  ORF Transcript_6340/g.12304 Transcript_6340/m.12304 type:complete len:277 (+) Transcript_6340:1272-2102(+)